MTAPPTTTMAPRSGRLRRWAPWAALVLVLAVVLAVGASRGGGHPSIESQTLSIAGRVRCPVCQGESAAASDTAAAQSIRQRIRADLVKGESSSEIVASLRADYGTSILESPPASGIALWAWVTPVAIAAVAAVGLALGFRHWRRPSRAVRLAVGTSAGSPGGGSPGGASPGGGSSGGAAVGARGRSDPGVSADDRALVREALEARARGRH